jgi:hypothetical protein
LPELTPSSAINRHRRKSFKRVYFFRDSEGQLGLTRYSNHSSIDVLIEHATLWLESQFEGGMWSGSFWTSYDVLTMMLDVGFGREIVSTPGSR